jgi:hypothetical protein
MTALAGVAFANSDDRTTGSVQGVGGGAEIKLNVTAMATARGMASTGTPATRT